MARLALRDSPTLWLVSSSTESQLGSGTGNIAMRSAAMTRFSRPTRTTASSICSCAFFHSGASPRSFARSNCACRIWLTLPPLDRSMAASPCGSSPMFAAIRI